MNTTRKKSKMVSKNGQTRINDQFLNTWSKTSRRSVNWYNVINITNAGIHIFLVIHSL